MKTKNLLLTLLALLLFVGIKAQEWPLPGAKWTYCVGGWSGAPAGGETFTVLGDTLISGNTYHVIGAVDTDNRKLLVRSSNDTVYRYVNNQEYLFFTFNLDLGDVFTTFRTAGANNHWEDAPCNEELPLKVIEVSEVELNGQLLKKFILEDTLFNHLHDYYPGEPITYTLIERIGVVNTYHFINTMEFSGNCDLMTCPPFVTLGEYTDDDFEYLFQACQGDGISDLEANTTVKISPNPSRNNVLIHCPSDAVYHVSFQDVNGKILKQVNDVTNGTHINVDNLPSGVYIVTFDNDNNKFQTKLTVLK